MKRNNLLRKTDQCERGLRFVYITTKTWRFHISIGYLISNEKIIMFITPASLMQKRHVFVVM